MPAHGPWKPWHELRNGMDYSKRSLKKNDLGVTMNANIKVTEQCIIAASLGDQITVVIWTHITHRQGFIVPLCKAIVEFT